MSDAPKEKPKRRRSRLFPLSAQNLVEPLLAAAVKERGFGEVQILTRWKDIVGPKLAAQCRPMHVQGGRGKQAERVLVVQVNPAFATDLQHQHPQILERIATFCGAKFVTKLQYVQTPMPKAVPAGMPAFPSVSSLRKAVPEISLPVATEGDALDAALASLAKTLQEKSRMA